MSTQPVEKANGNDHAIVRQEFGAVQEAQQPETAAMAVAAREKTAIEARYVMAERHPRSIEQFRIDILKECQRPGFAEVARYRRPVGKAKSAVTGQWEQTYAEGPTIRFIEAAIRAFRNIFPEVVTVFDNEAIRICRATVTDLEANIAYSTEVQIPKAVEKRGFQNRKTGEWEPPKGRDVVSQRTNSAGDTTYLVLATIDEIIVRQNALLSKAIRTQAQRLMPADIVDECMEAVLTTLRARDKEDPDASRRRLIDAFTALNIPPDELEQYLEKKLERIQPKDLEELRAVHAAIKDGQTTWEAIMIEKNPTVGSAEEQERVAAEKLASMRGGGKGKKKPKKKSPPAKGAATTEGEETADAAEPEEQATAPEPTGEEEHAESPDEASALTEAEMRAETAAQDEKPDNGKRLRFGQRKS